MMQQHMCFIIAFVIFACIMPASVMARSYQPTSLGNLFRNWMETYRISYETTEHENHAFEVWIHNHRYIAETNARNLTYKLGHNQFSGMDRDEFMYWVRTGYRGLYLFNNPTTYLRGSSVTATGQTVPLTDTLPVSVDWVEKGAVTPVKDQGQCGSCWSFSTTGALEGAYFLKNNRLVSFSEQQLVDCDNWQHGGRDHGCNGGLMDNAFDWIARNGGLCSEEDYPYISGDTMTSGVCHMDDYCQTVSGSGIAKYYNVPPNSDDAMMSALAKQPVSIAIEADQLDFQLYAGGVFTGTCGTSLDHGVLVVGYGTLDGNDYYKVKNSWSTSWGDDGYILLGRGEEYNGGAGQCGMLIEGSYPVMSV